MHNILHIGLSASYYDLILLYKYLQSDVMYLSMIAKDETSILLFEFVRRHRVIYIFLHVYVAFTISKYTYTQTHKHARGRIKSTAATMSFLYFINILLSYGLPIFFSLLSSDQTPPLHRWIFLRNVLCI